MLLSLALAAALAAAASRWVHAEAARRVAQAAIAFVDQRLDAVAAELTQLSADPAIREPWLAASDCPPSLTASLARASMDSVLVRRFHRVRFGAAGACGPLGPSRHDSLPQAPSGGITVFTGREIAVRPMVLRSLADGTALLAQLDPDSLIAPLGGLRAAGADGAIRIELLGTDALPIAAWGPRPSDHVESMRAYETSHLHPVTAVAEVNPALFASATARSIAAAMLLSLLVFAAFAAATWHFATRRSRMTYRLQLALRKRQFEPFVQPIVSLPGGECVGGEVLMRWAHPLRGIVAPGEFIDVAERTGLIEPMSDLIMNRAAHRLAPLGAANPGWSFSFNITPGQLRRGDLAQRLAEIFRADTLPREQVTLELTEREFVDPVAATNLRELRAAGWRIAIDDFGTGQSSLSTIEQLPIDRIKIDQAFIATLDEQTINRPVLDAIIGLARELRMPLIAEGVETASQAQWLAARGVACAQGYHYARPMDIETFGRWAAERSSPIMEGAAASDEIGPADRGLWQRMLSQQGLVVQDRQWRLQNFAQCFVGNEAVDWIVRERGVGRREALRIGRRLEALGLITHVADEHDFEDAHLFYRLTPPQRDGAAPAVAALGELRSMLYAARDLEWRSHDRGLLRHRHCASGREWVAWIARRYSVSRATAGQWAGQLMRQGAIRHVFDDQPFRDDRTLYRLA